MARVYVPHVPHRFSEGAGGMMPTVDLTKARKFGEIVVMLQPEDNILGMADKTSIISDKMSEFTAKDFFIGIGDPVLIAIVSYIAGCQADGMLRILRWDRIMRDYILVEVSP